MQNEANTPWREKRGSGRRFKAEFRFHENKKQLFKSQLSGWLTLHPQPAEIDFHLCRDLVSSSWHITLTNLRSNYQICSLLLALIWNLTIKNSLRGRWKVATHRGSKTCPWCITARFGKIWGNCSHELELIEENYTPDFYYKVFFFPPLFLPFIVCVAFLKLCWETPLQGGQNVAFLITLLKLLLICLKL